MTPLHYYFRVWILMDLSKNKGVSSWKQNVQQELQAHYRLVVTDCIFCFISWSNISLKFRSFNQWGYYILDIVLSLRDILFCNIFFFIYLFVIGKLVFLSWTVQYILMRGGTDFHWFRGTTNHQFKNPTNFNDYLKNFNEEMNMILSVINENPAFDITLVWSVT